MGREGERREEERSLEERGEGKRRGEEKPAPHTPPELADGPRGDSVWGMGGAARMTEDLEPIFKHGQQLLKSERFKGIFPYYSLHTTFP